MAALPVDLPGGQNTGLVLISLPSCQALEEHIWQERLAGDQEPEAAAVAAGQVSQAVPVPFPRSRG